MVVSAVEASGWAAVSAAVARAEDFKEREVKVESMKRTALVLTLVLSASLTNGCGYNRLVTQQEGVDAAWSEIDNQLKRRNDLIPNLVSTVKGFAAQEKDVLLSVTEARSRVAGAGTPAEAMDASNALSGALSRLMVVVERYPELKSNQNFLRLQDELAGTENRISVARMRYNESVRAFNTTTKRFPTNLVAGMFDFEGRDYFEVPEAAKAVPKVEF